MAGSAFHELARDLGQVFANRLKSLVAYGERTDEGAHTLALVEHLAFADLAKCAPRAGRWRQLGLATPLILTPHEFRRSLDVFPLEYGEIIDNHTVIAGADPFDGVTVNETDLRRGCERQAKSQLIHLREGFLETRRRPCRDRPADGRLGTDAPNAADQPGSTGPGVAARAGITGDLVREVTAADESAIADPSALLARYVSAVERLWQDVDGWR